MSPAGAARATAAAVAGDQSVWRRHPADAGAAVLAGSGRPTLPFPHPWNYHAADPHSRNVLLGRGRRAGAGPAQSLSRRARVRADPGDARSGRHPRHHHRNGRPARAVRSRHAALDRHRPRDRAATRCSIRNGAIWRRQRKLAASPFGKTTLFQPEMFHEFAETFRGTVARAARRAARSIWKRAASSRCALQLEPEIKAVMLEMLANNFFGAEIPYDELRNRYVPALERVIDHIVRDTVIEQARHSGPEAARASRRGIAQAKADYACFDELTDLVLAGAQGRQGAVEAVQVRRARTRRCAATSRCSWPARSKRRRRTRAGPSRTWPATRRPRRRSSKRCKDIDDYTPENLEQATYLGHVLDETLRLTPSLYFLPRRATADTWVETADGRKMFIPRGTHILLDVWHANRHEDHWGVAAPAIRRCEFVPERWA